MTKLHHPQHHALRGLLRVVGPVILLVGVGFTVSGFAGFLSAFGTFRPPPNIWHAFVGIPLMGIGGGITKFAYMGAIARYMAGEMAPVATDTVNYVGSGVRGTVRDLAGAVREGLHGERPGEGTGAGQQVRCPKCDALNDHNAKFCDACGAALPRARTCPACGTDNDHNARFCDACGERLVPTPGRT